MKLPTLTRNFWPKITVFSYVKFTILHFSVLPRHATYDSLWSPPAPVPAPAQCSSDSFHLAGGRKVSVLTENTYSRVVKNWKILMETSHHMRLSKHFSYLYGRSTPETSFVRVRDVRNDFSLVKWVVIKMCVLTEILCRHSHSRVNGV